MREIRDKTKKTLGGLFDPMTGELLPDRLRAFNEFSLREYTTRYHFDAVLDLNIEIRRAEFSRGAANWDGVEERVTSEKGLTAKLQGILSGGIGKDANAPAISLVARLFDTQQKLLYADAGGLSVYAFPTLQGDFVLYDYDALDTETIRSMVYRATTVALAHLALDPDSNKVLSFSLAPATKPVESVNFDLRKLRGTHPRVALASLTLWRRQLEQSDRVKSRYRDLLRRKLREAGFQLVDGTAFDEAWRSEIEATGGFFNRYTGELEKVPMEAARRRVLASLHESPPGYMLLMPSIEYRTARFREGRARWDGVTESLYDKSMGTVVPGSDRYEGQIGAISLHLQFIDESGLLISETRGGIQLLNRLIGTMMVPVPEKVLLDNAKDDELAVRVALPLLPPPSHPI
jgi:hypothetical protein